MYCFYDRIRLCIYYCMYIMIISNAILGYRKNDSVFSALDDMIR